MNGYPAMPGALQADVVEYLNGVLPRWFLFRFEGRPVLSRVLASHTIARDSS
jgi:hypothetical protein